MRTNDQLRTGPVALKTHTANAGLVRPTFKDALKKLNIEDYGERIFNSNSHGELMHLYDYIGMATRIKDDDAKWFRPLFVAVVERAKKNWSRPESCFQHMPRLLREMSEALSTNDAKIEPRAGEKEKP